jgi:hypothetical protein
MTVFLRRCERSAAVHAFRGHGLLHFVRNDDVFFQLKQAPPVLRQPFLELEFEGSMGPGFGLDAL